MSIPALIGVDWGTSSARAYRIDTDGRVIDARQAPLGLQKLEGLDFAQALAQLLGDWQQAPLPRIAAGMIGSRNGWVEVPYVGTPATLEALAAGVRTTPGGELAIVPGVMARDDGGVPDVMRGEETELFGALDDVDTDTLLVMPGTHAKWVHARAGRIVDFVTYMTGEVYDVMMSHSILGRLAHARGEPDGDAFVRGAALGARDGSLLHDLFAARTLVLSGELESAAVADFLSGLLIGREIRDALAWARHRGVERGVRLVGSHALAARYAMALDRAGVASRRVEGAAPRGLFRIAEAASLLPPDSSK